MRTTRERVHLVTRGHSRLRDKDGGHTSRSAIVENYMLDANVMALTFYRTGVIAYQSFTLRECSTFLAPVTLNLTGPDDLHVRTWPVRRGDIPDVHI